MARNSEKAMTALARWRQAFIEKKNIRQKRPPHTSMCDDLNEAIGYRKDIIYELAVRVGKIQNSSLGEHVIRDLNDEINRLLREKHHWDQRITELGGPNIKFALNDISKDGQEVIGTGYKYFGAAKDLPGVRELFSKQPPPAPKKTRGELQRSVNIDYYGFHDEDDGELVRHELEREKQIFLENKDKHDINDEEQIDKFIKERYNRNTNQPLLKVVKVPDQKEIEKLILDHYKDKLMNDLEENFSE